MAWAIETLDRLYGRYSYNQISERTGIPIATLSYVIRGERNLPTKYILPLRNAYARLNYLELREAGLPVQLARSLRWASTLKRADYLSSANSLIGQLVDYRYVEYNESRKRRGIWISDADTRDRLRQSITAAMGRSPIDVGKHEGADSPSLRHIVVVDEE